MHTVHTSGGGSGIRGTHVAVDEGMGIWGLWWLVIMVWKRTSVESGFSSVLSFLSVDLTQNSECVFVLFFCIHTHLVERWGGLGALYRI